MKIFREVKGIEEPEETLKTTGFVEKADPDEQKASMETEETEEEKWKREHGYETIVKRKE